MIKEYKKYFKKSRSKTGVNKTVGHDKGGCHSVVVGVLGCVTQYLGNLTDRLGIT